LIAVFLVIAGTYLFMKYRKNIVFLSIATALVAALYIIPSLHPPIRRFGSAGAWRAAYTAVFAGFIGYLWLARWKGNIIKFKRWPYFLLVGGLASMLVFFLGGNIRERARQPQSVYGQLEKPEATNYERSRFLTYDKCMQCHISPKDLKLPDGENWEQRLAIEQQRPGAIISDAEARSIIGYLEELK
jgi:hypothetical protein